MVFVSVKAYVWDEVLTWQSILFGRPHIRLCNGVEPVNFPPQPHILFFSHWWPAAQPLSLTLHTLMQVSYSGTRWWRRKLGCHTVETRSLFELSSTENLWWWAIKFIFFFQQGRQRRREEEEEQRRRRRELVCVVSNLINPLLRWRSTQMCVFVSPWFKMEITETTPSC